MTTVMPGFRLELRAARRSDNPDENTREEPGML